MEIKLCVFASSRDMEGLEFPIKPLTGSLREVAKTAVDWGYDGFELIVNPENVPQADEVRVALAETGAILPVVNSGRMPGQGMALLHKDVAERRRAMEAFNRLIDLAGEIEAKVGLGIARGGPDVIVTGADLEPVMDQVFGDMAARAERAGTVVMLEPSDPGAMNNITTCAEAVRWVERIGSKGFGIMLDTYQLVSSEESVEKGLLDAKGLGTHIHLYDPGRFPPGMRPDSEVLDWDQMVEILAKQGFAGTGSVTPAPEGDQAAAAALSNTYLRKLFAEAGHAAAPA